MNVLTFISALLEKSGMNKGDASTASGLGLGGLGIVFLLFVSRSSYDAGVATQVAENNKIWKQVHIIMDACDQAGVYIPNFDDPSITTKTNKITK